MMRPKLAVRHRIDAAAQDRVDRTFAVLVVTLASCRCCRKPSSVASACPVRLAPLTVPVRAASLPGEVRAGRRREAEAGGKRRDIPIQTAGARDSRNSSRCRVRPKCRLPPPGQKAVVAPTTDKEVLKLAPVPAAASARNDGLARHAVDRELGWGLAEVVVHGRIYAAAGRGQTAMPVVISSWRHQRTGGWTPPAGAAKVPLAANRKLPTVSRSGREIRGLRLHERVEIARQSGFRKCSNRRCWYRP